jgi:hypothetical protein
MNPRTPAEQASTAVRVFGVGTDTSGPFRRDGLGVLVAPRVALTAAHFWRPSLGRDGEPPVAQEVLATMEMFALPARLRVYGRPPTNTRAEVIDDDQFRDLALLRLSE